MGSTECRAKELLNRGWRKVRRKNRRPGDGGHNSLAGNFTYTKAKKEETLKKRRRNPTKQIHLIFLILILNFLELSFPNILLNKTSI